MLHFLTGLRGVDGRLDPLVKPWPAPEQLAPSQRVIAEQVAAAWSQGHRRQIVPVVELCGAEAEGKRHIAAAAAAIVGLQLHIAAARNIGSQAGDIDAFLRLWRRDAALNSSALLLELEDDAGDAAHAGGDRVADWIRSGGAFLVSTNGPRRCAYRTVMVFDVTRPTRSEQSEIWTNLLGGAATAVNGTVEALVSQFQLNSTAIRQRRRVEPPIGGSTRIRNWSMRRSKTRTH